MNIIPDIIILDAYKAVIAFLRRDLSEKENEEDTILYKILGSNFLQRYGLFEQAKAIFNDDVDNPRKIDINMFFNMSRLGLPTVHIMMHSESPESDGIGIDEGYNDSIYIPNEDESGNITSYDVQKVLNRGFRSTYNVVFTSENTNEVLTMFHVFRALSIPLIDHLEVSGLKNISISVEELTPITDIVPQHVFMRSLAISFIYDVKGYYHFSGGLLSNIIFNGVPVYEDESGTTIIPPDFDNQTYVIEIIAGEGVEVDSSDPEYPIVTVLPTSSVQRFRPTTIVSSYVQDDRLIEGLTEEQVEVQYNNQNLHKDIHYMFDLNDNRLVAISPFTFSTSSTTKIFIKIYSV